jgi:hypothetical protein
MAVATKKKKVVKRRAKSTSGEPNLSNGLELSGQEFYRAKSEALNYYRLEYKPADFKKWTMDFVSSSDEWKKKKTAIGKNRDADFSSTLGGLCRLLNNGAPDLHPGVQEYMDRMPGLTGESKPMTYFINKKLEDLYNIGLTLVEEKKEEEKKANTKKHVPTIQERIREQSLLACEKIEDWLDTWRQDPDSFKPKAFNFPKHFLEFKVTQAHARKIIDFYTPEMQEFTEVLNPPTKAQLAKMSEQEQDWAEQLKEGYSHINKKQAQKYLEALNVLVGACNVVIDTSKAQRKPRKRVRSVEKIVAKLKYKISDDKYQLASISPTDIIGASELWVFNTKTRKLGKYVAKNPDPLGTRRDGSGLGIKGTTITGFDEENSIQKTLRKPEEVLKEFKAAGKIKLRKFLEEIQTTDTKLNGRINPDTIILKSAD